MIKAAVNTSMNKDNVQIHHESVQPHEFAFPVGAANHATDDEKPGTSMEDFSEERKAMSLSLRHESVSPP